MDKSKLILPISIILAGIILGGFFYAIQINKQNSIEKQQELKLQAEEKEYIAKRRGECYDIYLKEKVAGTPNLRH